MGIPIRGQEGGGNGVEDLSRRVEPLMGEHLELLLGDYRRALGQKRFESGRSGS